MRYQDSPDYVVEHQMNTFLFVLRCHLKGFLIPERGVVWEETIILLPDNVHYVFLSATIPNATQFAEWVCHLHKQVHREYFLSLY